LVCQTGKIKPQRSCQPADAALSSAAVMKFIRTMMVLVLAAGMARAEGEEGTAAFAPRPFVLAPDEAPEVPMPEAGLGEPLPANPQAAAQETLTAQGATSAVPQDEEAARREQTNRLFVAIDEGDIASVQNLLDGGVGPDSTLPAPLDESMLERFRKDFLLYYVTKESGLTPLMFAAARGHRDIAELLVARGAKKNARTKRHGTDALWLAGYAGKSDVIQFLLGVTPESEASRTLVEVDLSSQTATILRDQAVVKTAPISSGKKKFRTPTGEYVVTNKHRQWKSTLYGASMPFYLRLSCRDFGLHAGHLPGYPASHGCIRLRQKDAAEFFKQVPIGTKVVIK
jgi:hypothetical protein